MWHVDNKLVNTMIVLTIIDLKKNSVYGRKIEHHWAYKKNIRIENQVNGCSKLKTRVSQ